MSAALPSVPPELKPVQPYLQRADEVAKTDPVVAYWCTYYAAQLGIGLKTKDNAARTFLFDLLGLLEKMKTDIGQNDAIEDDNAGAAYVENFALRVFAAADNEDRRGSATRATAKKFLAAANFLEVLAVFQSNEGSAMTVDVPEKIRYAKWKAADIAKAFREGRKPTPGGANEVHEPEVVAPTTPPQTYLQPESTSPPSIHRDTPPPGPLNDLPPSTPPQGQFGHLMPPSGFPDPKATPMSPGAWSTAATPGTPHDEWDSGSQAITPPKSSLRQTAFVSDEMEGFDEDVVEIHESAHSPSSSDSSKKVHFTPSVVGGLTPSTLHPNDPTVSPSHPSYDPMTGSGLPPGFIPSAPSFEQNDPSAQLSFPPGFVPSPHSPMTPLPPPPVIPSSSHFPTAPLPILSYPSPQPAYPQPAAATITTTPEELSSATITKIQKHCRFAISALDYEDAEQARKELRTALQLLGG